MNVSKCWHLTCFVRWANRIAIFSFWWKLNLRLPPRKKKTLPLKVVCLLMLLDWPEKEFRIHCASFNDNDIPLSPQFQRWLRHAQVLTKRSVFFLWRASTPRTLFYPSTLNLGVRGGAQEILASVRHKSWKSNRVAVAVITRSVFFLRGGSHSNHFSSKTESLSFNSPSKQSMRQRLSTFLTRQTTKQNQLAKQFHQRDRRPQWNTLLECWCCIYVAQHLSWNKQSILARASAPEEMEKHTDAPPKIHVEIR